MLRLETSKVDHTPIYLQIKKQIENYIVNQKLPVDSALPDVRKIAQLAGVSVRTADQALLALVDAGVCYRRPKRGTYVKRSTFIDNGLKKIVGIYCPFRASQIEDYLLEHTAYKGIIGTSGDCGVTPFFITGDLFSSIEFYHNSRESVLTGVVLLSWLPGSYKISDLRQFSPTQFVLINFDIKSVVEEAPENVTFVFNDDYLGGYQIAEYMIRQGHKRFGILTFDCGDDNYKHRVEGFVQAFRDNGIQFGQDCLINTGSMLQNDLPKLKELGIELLAGRNVHFSDNWSFLQGQVGMGGLMYDIVRSRDKEVTAVLCVNDWLAFGAHIAAGKNGNAISVAGYDNIMPELSQGGGFPTVEIDCKEMGKRAISLLSGKSKYTGQVIRIMPRLIPRTSRCE